MNDGEEKEPQAINVEQWFADKKAWSQKMLEEGRIPMVWIDTSDIVDAFEQGDIPKPTEDQAQKFLAGNFDRIEEELWNVIGPFWDLIASLAEQKDDQQDDTIQ